MQQLIILTGASRGMGQAMARQLLQPGCHLLTMARQPEAALADLAAERGAQLTQWAADLANPLPVAERLLQWLQAQPGAQIQGSALINNAGAISELAPLGDVPLAGLSQALRVGLEAALLLSSAYLQATAHWPGARKVLNISSGLGRRAMAGSASYCAAKAGMDHLSRAMALEQAALPKGARVCSLAPGVIDTDMQAQLRGADARFTERSMFQGLKENGQLMTPEQAATKVLAYLQRADFGVNPIGDVRDA